MSRYELEVRHSDGEFIGSIVWNNGDFQIAEKSNKRFAKAIDFLFSGPQEVSYWDGSSVIRRSIRGGTLDAIDALIQYLSHNYKMNARVKYAQFAKQLAFEFSLGDGTKLETLDNIAQYYRTVWPHRHICMPQQFSIGQLSLLDRRSFEKVKANRDVITSITDNSIVLPKEQFSMAA